MFKWARSMTLWYVRVAKYSTPQNPKKATLMGKRQYIGIRALTFSDKPMLLPFQRFALKMLDVDSLKREGQTLGFPKVSDSKMRVLPCSFQ